MKLIHYINKQINEYSILYSRPNFFSSQLRVLDQLFGVLGNGLEWAKTVRPEDGGYLCTPTYSSEEAVYDNDNYIRDFDPPYGEEVYTETPILAPLSTSYEFQPYPAFDKEYSPLWETDFIQEDWKMGALLWLHECNNYFNDQERVKKYLYYPSEKNKIDLKKHVTTLMSKDSVEQINKDYGTICFNGNNLEEFAQERWMNTLNDTLKFIEETTIRLITI